MRSVKTTTLMSRTALLGAALAAAVAVSGCSAGQVTQTDTQVPPITGTDADLVDFEAGLRDVQVEFNSDGYGQGSSAPLAVRVFNSSTTTPVTLTGVESADAEAVTLVDAPGQEDESTQDAEEDPTQDPEEEPGDDTTEEPDDDTGTDDQQQGDPQINEEIAPLDKLLLTTQQEQYLQVEGLSKDINPGDHITLTFEFGDHGKVEMIVPMAMPADAESRESAEFEDDEGH